MNPVAGMSGRMSTVIKAKIGKLLDKAEDPGETLEYSYQRQMELLQNVKKGIADVVTSKKRLQLQQQKLEQQVVKLDTQARQALAAGREDLARTALERKQFAQTELQTLDQQVVELESQQQGLVDKTEGMRARASAMEELEEAGAFDDNLTLTAGQDDIDRQLHELTSGSQVEDDLAKLKAEIGQGGAPAPALGEGKADQPAQPGGQ